MITNDMVLFVSGTIFGAGLVLTGVWMGLGPLLFIVACMGSYALGAYIAWGAKRNV